MTQTSTVSVAGHTRDHARLLDIDPDLFRAGYNRTPFLFKHRLTDHPLLQMDSLVALANRLRPNKVMHTAGKVSVAVDFDAALNKRGSGLSVDQVLTDMQNTDAYVLLHRVEEDPEYAELLETALGDIRPFTEPIDPGMCDAAAYIFIASPGAVTPYHMDREMNFLCQVRGTKAVQLWDQDDTSILTEPEIETIFARPSEPKPAYKPEYEAKAINLTIGPGAGVHQPLLAPHAMRNGDTDFSIAMAITFRTRAANRRIVVHKLNWRLRQLGSNPTWGRSPTVDTVKFHGMRSYLGVRRRLGRG